MIETEDYQLPGVVGLHAISHQHGGSDEINVQGLSGQLADNQKSTWDLVSGKPSTFPPSSHASIHQYGGSDEINLEGLSGKCQFYDRGDPASFDWLVGNLITDGQWHDLDCSSVVPVGARFIYFRVRLQGATSGAYFSLRKKGYVNSPAYRNCILQVANVINENYLLVPCDDNRYVQYNAQNISWTLISICILGWII